MNNKTYSLSNDAFFTLLLRAVRNMRESVTFQAILEEGRDEGRLIEARRLVFRAAIKRLGEAPAGAEATLDTVTSLKTLEALHDRVFEVETWDEFLRGLT